MPPTTREEFKAYCLRALGDGVIQINVSPDQVEDRVDEALYMFQQFHMDAVVKNFLRHEITASIMTFTSDVGASFFNHEIIRGGTSNAVGQIVLAGIPGDNAFTFFTTAGVFVAGETVTGRNSGSTGVIANTVLGDFDNKYFTVPDAMLAITRIFPQEGFLSGGDILFDPQSQFTMSMTANFATGGVAPYVITRQYMQLLNDTFRGRPSIRFQRHMNRLSIDINWINTFRPGNFIIIEGFQTIDPTDFPDVWSDRWLQNYATALLKRQWGMNLSKYTGVSLPGGVNLDGRSMLADAKLEIAEMEKQLQDTFQLPIDFIVG